MDKVHLIYLPSRPAARLDLEQCHADAMPCHVVPGHEPLSFTKVVHQATRRRHVQGSFGVVLDGIGEREEKPQDASLPVVTPARFNRGKTGMAG